MKPSYASDNTSSTSDQTRTSYSNSIHCIPKTYKVTGVVICFNASFPLEGVVVREKGTNNQTVTKRDGTWELELIQGKKTLEFSFAGFDNMHVTINNSLPFQVIMKRTYNPMSNLVDSSINPHVINR